MKNVTWNDVNEGSAIEVLNVQEIDNVSGGIWGAVAKGAAKVGKYLWKKRKTIGKAAVYTAKPEDAE